MSGGSDSISVAIDALPLAGSLTGIGVFCDNLCRQLAGMQDVELHAYAVSSHPDLVRERLPAGTPLKTVRLATRAVNASWRHGGPPSGESLANGCSVLHGTNYVVPPARRVARVVTVHDMTAWRFPELCSPATLAYPALLRKALSSGAFVHAVSRFTADEVIELAGADESRVTVVPSAPSPGPGAPDATARHGSDMPGRPYVLAVGTVEPRKDYPTLVKAVAELAVELPDVRLVIAGGAGWGEAALDQAIAVTASADRVTRLGYVTEAERAGLLQGALLLAYPSLYEGFGLPPLEAMAAGIPVVATNGGSIAEVAGDGAEVVPVGDAHALAAAMIRVIQDSGFREGLITRGRLRASAYSWASTAEQMVALYRQARDARS